MFDQNFNIILRAFLLGCQNFIRNAWLTIAAIAIMVVALTFLLSGVILNTTFKNATTYFSQNLRTPIYLYNWVDEDAVAPLRAELLSKDYIATVTYVDKQSAKERFNELAKNDAKISEAAERLPSEDIFPASLRVSFSNLDGVDEVRDIVRSDTYANIVEDDRFDRSDARGAIERAISIRDSLIRVSVIFTLTFGVVAFLIIFNTIRVAIFSRREEVQIMRLVGAPSRFIREPFLVEAGLYGAAGGLIAVSLVYGVLWVFGDSIASVGELAASYEYFFHNRLVVFLMFFGTIVSGVLFSTFSCIMALQAHLKF